MLSLIFIWWLFKIYFDFLTGVDGLGFKAHKTCIEMVQNKGSYDFLNLKILCSYNSVTLKNNLSHELSEIFKGLGLVHLLVASGTHLLILKKTFQGFLAFWTKSKAPLYIILFIFILCSNFSGPVTRCFVQILISHSSKRYSLGLSSINITLVSSAVYLLFFPQAFLTLSFWLSVSASLILALFSKSIFLLSIVFYFALMPYILDFSLPQTSSILVNILLTPLLAPLIILNSVFYVLVPEYYKIGDELLRLTLITLDHFLIGTSAIGWNTIKVNSAFKIMYGLVFALITLSFQNLRSDRIFFEIHHRCKN